MELQKEERHLIGLLTELLASEWSTFGILIQFTVFLSTYSASIPKSLLAAIALDLIQCLDSFSMYKSYWVNTGTFDSE